MIKLSYSVYTSSTPSRKCKHMRHGELISLGDDRQKRKHKAQADRVVLPVCGGRCTSYHNKNKNTNTTQKRHSHTNTGRHHIQIHTRTHARTHRDRHARQHPPDDNTPVMRCPTSSLRFWKRLSDDSSDDGG
jgi:hypothetical protein